MRISFVRSLLFAVPVASVLAQTPALQMNIVYQCPAVRATMQVYSCAGPAAGDWCDVQTAPQGRPAMRGKSTRQQVMGLLAICHPQTPVEAKAVPGGAAAPGNVTAGNAGGGVGPGGFKAGDQVRILSDGWQDARVLQVHGNAYFVQMGNGVQVSKIWPMEVRREGKLTAEDHAAGQYDKGERVQVLVNGRWMEGNVRGQNLNMYSIKVPGVDTGFGSDIVDTTPENIRMSTTPAPPPPSKRAAGQAPKAGLASCGSKYDGRWESTTGMAGNRFVFRSGKVAVTEGLSNPIELECFMGGGEVILYDAGSFKEHETLEVNKDGTLQTELGAIKKMNEWTVPVIRRRFFGPLIHEFRARKSRDRDR